ncbi:MAG: ATP-binding protein [Bacilli bacterium]|nr:ATP-binding protein [Bacilli bacterium]
MKTTKLFALAASMILLASCSNGGSSSAAPTASSAEEASSSSIRVRPSSSSTEVSRQTEALLPDTLPTIAGTNVTFIESLRTGGENEAKKNPGNLYEWHGDGGSITGFVYENGEYSFNYSSTWRWYGCQLFYVLPYEEAGDTYTVRLRLYSDIDGDITINGTVYSLVWGWNVITFDVTTAAKDSSIISMQLGVSETNTSLPGSYMKLKDIEVYDAVNTYHKVDFLVGESDIYSLLGNILDNAIEATVQLPEGQRSISLTVKKAHGFAHINADNPYMEKNLRFGQDGLPLTSKENKANHGYGIKSIAYVAEKYHGDLSIKAEDGVFSLSVMIPLDQSSAA